MDAAFIDRLLARDPRAVARALSVVVDESPDAAALLRSLHGRPGHAVVIGVTGPPGAGKSTLVDQLISMFRHAGETVAVLAIDPSSPFTGGAMLGDRVRMQAHAADANVFIRSLATRGYGGGLTSTSRDAVTVLNAAGFERIILETVGVGQGEIDVARLADVCVVVLVPGAGDDVQALKAGLMEIADVFVVNKADREGADRMVAVIMAAESMANPEEHRPIPVLPVVATTGQGVAALMSAIEDVRRDTGNVEARRAARRPALMGDAVIRLDHIGIAVDSGSTLLAFLHEAFGIEAGSPEPVPSQHVRVRFAECDGARLELIEPTDDTSPVARFLSRRGPGLHHIAFEITDLSALLIALKTRGVRLIDEAPRVGAHGRAIAFVHPSSAGGVLVELVEKEGRSRAVR